MSSDPVKDTEKFLSDPDRVKAALVTHGVSETARFVQDEGGRVQKSLLPDPPDLEKQDAPPTENSDSVRAAQEAETARSRKGRASTMLSGTSSLTSSPLSLSRKTLLGA